MSNVEATQPNHVRGQVSAEEWALRVDLAACYRLVAHFGWDDLLFTHNSARIPGSDHHFLINPLGLRFDEITASSLVKIDLDGNKAMDSPYGIIKAGFTIHSAIHINNKDAHCVMHTHTAEGMAVAAQAHGLLMLNQKSCAFHKRLGYHAFEGVADDLDERDRLAADLGPHKAMILTNHGLLTTGATVGEAFIVHRRLQEACRLQLMALAGDSMVCVIPDAVAEKTARQYADADTDGKSISLQWAALLRLLDAKDPGFRD